MNQQCFPPMLKLSIFNFQLSINKRSFQKPIHTFLIVLLSLLHYALSAQTGCPDCELVLPDSLQEDTFYLQEFPDGQFRVAYDESVTYRLPTNTSQILYLIPSLPSGIGIGDLSIKSINNLPAGLSWEPSQKSYNLPDERDGCIRICGTPLQFGLFKLEFTVTAQISIISQDASFSRDFYIAPPSTTNSGFRITNNVGCGSTTVNFENNNPSNGQSGFSYQWDLGLGNTITDETPAPQLYEVPGVYPIAYQAIIDTVGYILTSIKIKDLSCDDFLGKPDIKLRITDPSDNIIFENKSTENLEPPLNFPVSIDLAAGNYTLEVIDEDSGLGGGDDLCGTINFNQLSNGNLEDGDLKVELTVFHPVDTVNVQDSVVIYANPAAPIISFDGTTLFCEGDTLILNASATANQQQWYKDSMLIQGATKTTFKATKRGQYYLTTTNENGCINHSNPIFISPTPKPPAPVLSQESNLLRIFNPAILPENFSLRWFQEGNLLDNTSYQFCISETSKYGIELTNSTSGCSNYFESVYSYDENGVCTSPTEDLSASIATVNIYPNPVSERLTIGLSTHRLLKGGAVRIVNILGKTLNYQIIDAYSLTQQLQFDVSAYAPGLYLVQLQAENKVSSWKVLKQ